ncbi:MAG: universal stress protein [Cyanobacteria bacterium P01_D01_bin.73]
MGKKILLADSGTGQSEEMLKSLMEIPFFKDSQVAILHVVVAEISAEYLAERMKEGEETLAKAIARLGLPEGQVSTKLVQGDPKVVVLEVADELDSDLILMGSRGLKRLRSILSNSVSQYVFQLSSRSMLLVRDDVYVKRLNRVMVAVDSSEASQQALNEAIMYARDYVGQELTLVHVNSKLKPGEEIPGETDPVLQPAIAAVRRYNIDVRAVSIGGRPGPTLCNLAKEKNADMIMLGSPDRRPSIAKGLPDLDRLLGSSLSDYVRVYAPCPVLLSRPKTQ